MAKTSSKLPSTATAPASQDVLLAVDHASFLTRQEGVLKVYLEKVRIWHGYARFIGLPALVDTSKDVPLERLYVPPSLSTGAIQPETMNDPADKLPPTLDLLDSLLAHPRLVVLGDPGSGKSTLINYIADSLSRPSHSELRTRLGADLVPLPFILRELGIGEDITWDALCTAFLARPVGQTLGKDENERRQNLDALLRSGQGWVMLDGLDEIGSASVRRTLRDIYYFAARDFPNTRFLLTSRIVGYEEVPFDLDYAEVPMKDGGVMRVRVAKDSIFRQAGTILEADIPDEESRTSRENIETLRAYIEEIRQVVERYGSSSTQRLYLVPFNDAQVSAFTRHWWMHHRGNPALAAAEAEEFLAALHAKQDTRTLGRVPNLLVLIALVYKVFVKLPDGRAELYWKIAEAYLENIDRSYQLKQRLPYGFRQMAAWLGHVAWQMQLRRHQEATQKKTKPKGQPRTEILITHAEALEHLTAAIQHEVSSVTEARSLATTFLDYAARRSGLFIPRGVDANHQELYAFMHLSFQEFFCAVHLQERVGRMTWWRENVFAQTDGSEFALPALRECASRSEWMEVFVFLFEMLQVGDPDKPSDFLRALLEEPQGQDCWRSFDAPFPATVLDRFQGSASVPVPASVPRMAHANLVKLVAAIAMNSEIRLAPATRQQLLCKAWEWEVQRCVDGHQVWLGDNSVARVLLARRADLGASWQALASLGGSVKHLSLVGCSALAQLQPLTALSALQHLNLSECPGISDLEPLQTLRSLNHLHLDGCIALTDLHPLTKLTSLKSLHLTGCHSLTDLKPLQSLTSLQSLRLGGNALNNLQPLLSLSSLQTLFLKDCNLLTDLHPVQALTSLRSLNISGCPSLSDIHPLQSLASLQSLTLLDCTKLTDIQALKSLSSLQSLNLAGCSILADLEPLSTLTSLKSLYLYGCATLSDLHPLLGMTSLHFVNISGCHGLKGSPIIAELKKRNVRVLGPEGSRPKKVLRRKP